jgi:hypothetical protein
MAALAETLQRVSTAAYQAAAASGSGAGGDGTGDGTGTPAGEGADEPGTTSDEETVEGEFKEV